MQTVSTKEFPLDAVLGVITRDLLMDGGFDRIHGLIEWMANQPIYTHQLPQVGRICGASLKKQFPILNPDENSSLAGRIEWLLGVLTDKRRRNPGDKDETAAQIWKKLKSEYGDSFQVAPLEPVAPDDSFPETL